MSIRADGLVLTVDKNPETYFVLRKVEVVRYACLEGTVRLLLQNTETRQLRRWPVLFIERSKIKAFMMSKCIIRDDLSDVSRTGG